MTGPRYLILSASGVSSLAGIVCDHIDKGYVPIGGVTISGKLFYQAMVWG